MADISGAVESIIAKHLLVIQKYQQQVTGDPAALSRTANEKLTEADRVRAVADAMFADSKQLSGFWQGAAHDAFKKALTDLGTNMVMGPEQKLRQTADRLSTAAGVLTKARTEVDAVHARLEQQGRTLVALARSVSNDQIRATLENAGKVGATAVFDAQQIANRVGKELAGLFGAPGEFRLSGDDIEKLYRVPRYEPANVDYPPGVPMTKLTQTEAGVLRQLSLPDQVKAMQISNEAETLAMRYYEERVPHEKWKDFREVSPDGGHANAFKHTYWNARLSQAFGPEWTEAFTTAHEMVLGNRPPSESMDMFNNQLGRQIGAENPGLSPSQLAAKVQEAVANGRTVVVDLNGKIQYSDLVQRGQTGK